MKDAGERHQQPYPYLSTRKSIANLLNKMCLFVQYWYYSYKGSQSLSDLFWSPLYIREPKHGLKKKVKLMVGMLIDHSGECNTISWHIVKLSFKYLWLCSWINATLSFNRESFSLQLIKVNSDTLGSK